VVDFPNRPAPNADAIPEGMRRASDRRKSMNGTGRRWLLTTVLVSMYCISTASGQEADKSCPSGGDEAPEVHNHTLERAGNPQILSCLAVPSDTGAYVGYQVGGGCACPHFGDAPAPLDGTWGWDYQGRCFLRRVCLLWWHGRCEQGGVGAYCTDGPKLKHEK
jgi:hypothetical protein